MVPKPIMDANVALIAVLMTPNEAPTRAKIKYLNTKCREILKIIPSLLA